MDKDYKRKLINLVVADALQVNDMIDLQDFAANLLILGVKALTDLSIKELEQEVFTRWGYSFDPRESEEFSENDKAFKEWVINKEIKEHYIATSLL